MPAASFAGAAPAAPGYYFSLGKVREDTHGEAPSPVVAMGSGTWGLGRDSSAGFGLLSTDDYWSAGGTLSSVFFQRVSVGARHNHSRDSRNAVSGGRSSVSVSSPVSASVDLSLSATTQSRGYREVLETGRSFKAGELDSRFKNQYTAGISWVDPTLGAFSLTQETVLELVHPRVGEQQGRVVIRDQGAGRDTGVTLLFEEAKEGFTDFCAFH